MKTNSMRERLLATSMICGVALLASHAVAAEKTAANEVTEVVVTGSRIPQPNLTSVSPVTVINAGDIKAQGVTRIEDMINSLPQAFAGQGSMISNGSNGTASVNLRGMGSSRTLVLIDGRRVMPGQPGGAAVDLNFIPSSLVQRVDVLTGGATSTYGADAVAGVVNFIMQRNFEGVRFDAQYGTYQHQNDNSVQSVVKAKQATATDKSQFQLPNKNVTDGAGSSVSLAFGVNSPDGKGNITAYATWRQNNPILQGQRDYSVCTLGSGDNFSCGGSGTANPARFGSYIVDSSGPGNTFRLRNGATDVYNYGPTNYYQRPDTRYNLGAFANYELAPWATVYMDAMFMDDRSIAQIAPGGIFAGSWTINCDNAFMTSVQQGQLCGTSAGTTTLKTLTISRRNVEGGTRTSDFQHTDYRIVTGVRGDINEQWAYDAYLQYGHVAYNEQKDGYFVTPKINNALIARKDSTGKIVCQSVIDGTDKTCVPYNIFQIGGVTKAALTYLQASSFSKGETTEQVGSFAVTGKLGDYGVKLPWTSEGVGVAIGGEYRSEYTNSVSDYISASGLLNGAGGASPPVKGSYDVYEGFAEARVPLVEDLPFAKRIGLDLGYRYSSYSSTDTSTYKIMGDWEIMDGLRVRAGYNKAIRAPNTSELFSPQNVVLDGTTDPCAGLKSTDALVATCAKAFNLTTAQVLAIEKNPAPQYNGMTGGNPNLKPETGNTYSLGVVYQPSFVPGLNLSVDYFNIKVEDAIGGIGADVAISRCLKTLDPYFCGLVHRNAAGSLWLGTDGYIVDTTLNTGSLATTGVDFVAGYRTDLDRFGITGMGSVNADFVGTWLDTLTTETLPGDPKFDCVGLFGTKCGTPNPEWRHKLHVNWATPFWGNLQVGATWRYFSKVTLDAYDSDPNLNNPSSQYVTDKTLKAQSYLDLSASVKLHDNYSLRVGVNNVLDRDPPLVGSSNCPTGSCNGNTYPQVYDAVGRFMFVGLKADF